REEAEAMMSTAAQEEHAMVEPMPADASPVIRARGTFAGADSVHMGSGDALLVDAGGGLIVRLENFRVTNGPDLYVYLSSHPNPRTRDDVHEGTVNLGRLKGNIGAQNYTVPSGTDPAAVRSVVIYCQRFHVLFAAAPLQRGP
ncbi:MAG: DM13 domain-containing protein, partial [bacterium]